MADTRMEKFKDVAILTSALVGIVLAIDVQLRLAGASADVILNMTLFMGIVILAVFAIRDLRGKS